MKRSLFFSIIQVTNDTPEVIINLAGAMYMNMNLGFCDTPLVTSEIMQAWYIYLANEL